MAKYEDPNQLDYRNGGDTVDDFAQKYMRTIAYVFKALNDLRTPTGNTAGVEPEPYMWRIADNKLYIRNGDNTDYVLLGEISPNFGFRQSVNDRFLTTADLEGEGAVVTRNEAGKVEGDITGSPGKIAGKTIDVTPSADNDVIAYDAAQQKWVKKTLNDYLKKQGDAGWDEMVDEVADQVIEDITPIIFNFWYLDDDGYLVPLVGSTEGGLPSIHGMVGDYEQITARSVDVAGNLSATGNVTAGMVTTPQANVTTLTANAVNAGTLTANDIIAKGPIVDVRAFGAKGDGVTDDTSAIQAAIDYAESLSTADTTIFGNIQPTTVIIPLGTYKITSTINVDSFKVSLQGLGAILDARSIEGYAMIIGHDGTGSQGQCRSIMQGFGLKGSREANHYGIKKIGDARTDYKNIEICSFERGMEEFDNSYLCSFTCIEIHDCTAGFVVNSDAVNNGERTSFINCIFYNNATDIKDDTPNSEIYCTQCSFDYSAVAYDNGGNDGTIVYSNCHFEWGHDEYYGGESWDGSKFKIGASQFRIAFNSCSFHYVDPEVSSKFHYLIDSTSVNAFNGLNTFNDCYFFAVGNAYTALCSSSLVRLENSKLQNPPTLALPQFNSYEMAQSNGDSFVGVPQNCVSVGGTLSVNNSGELQYTSTGGGSVRFSFPIDAVAFRWGVTLKTSATVGFADYNAEYGTISPDGTFNKIAGMGGKNITDALNNPVGTEVTYNDFGFNQTAMYTHTAEKMYYSVYFTFPGLASGTVITFSKMYIEKC